nr:subfamily S9B unassigned peptidase (S09 family) [Hymenolepis microstoma]
MAKSSGIACNLIVAGKIRVCARRSGTSFPSSDRLDSIQMKESDWNVQTLKPSETAKSWRGVLLAAVVIILILSILIISVLYVTPKNVFAYANDKGLAVISNKSSEINQKYSRREVLNLSTEKDIKVSKIWSCMNGNYFLVRYENIRSYSQDQRPVFEIVQGGKIMPNADVLRIRELRNEKMQFQPVVVASCFPNSNVVVAVAGGHIFSTRHVLSDVNANYGFKCLSCGISQQIFAELSPEYQGLFGYQFNTALWISAVGSEKVLALTLDPQNKVTLGAAVFELDESKPPRMITTALLRNAIAHSVPEDSYYIFDAQWIDNDTVILKVINGNQRHLWIIACSLETDLPYCTQSWDFINEQYPLDNIPNHYRNHERGAYYTTLPELIENRLQYRVAKLNFIKGGKIESHIWLTPKELNVESLEQVMNNYVWFTSAFVVEGSKHLLRLDTADGTTVCLTYFVGTSNETNIYSRLAYVTVSGGGSSFAAQFDTGYEFFEPLQLQRSAANFFQNRLTGSITDTYGEADAKVISNHLIKPITTCHWMERKQIATDIYVFSYLKEKAITKLLWRNSLMTVLLRNSTNSRNEPVRKRRSVDMENVHIPEEQISQKVGNKDDAAKFKLKARRLFKHMPLGLSFLVSNAADEGKQFWMPYSTLRCLIIKKSALNTLEDDCNVLVRFWYPPNLNENHITQYAFLLIVRKNLRRCEGDNLYEKLAFSLSSHKRVIVGRVENWLGVCRNLYSTENPISQVALYRSLLKAVQANYHYINPDQIAVIGKRGADAHLAGLILASGHSPILPRCGVLITPITDYSKTVSTLAERYLKSYKENESKYVMVNLVQNPLNLLDKSIFVIHEYSDSLYSFNQTAELCQFFTKNKIDHDLKLHPCGASGTLTIEEQVSFIKEVSDFLLDCFNRTSHRWDKIPKFINRE